MKDTLAVSTPSETQILIARQFEAPRRLVWRAMAEPALLRQWLPGPPGWTMTQCEQDWRVGGAFSYAWRGPDGGEMAMRGVFRDLVEPERVARSEAFTYLGSAWSEENRAEIRLTEQDGRTTLVLTVTFPSRAARDAAIASGMAQGLAESYGKLDGVLAAAQEA